MHQCKNDHCNRRKFKSIVFKIQHANQKWTYSDKVTNTCYGYTVSLRFPVLSSFSASFFLLLFSSCFWNPPPPKSTLYIVGDLGFLCDAKGWREAWVAYVEYLLEILWDYLITEAVRRLCSWSVVWRGELREIVCVKKKVREKRWGGAKTDIGRCWEK